MLDARLRFAMIDLENVANVFRIGLIGAGSRADEIDEEDGDELSLLLLWQRIAEWTPAAVAEAGADRVRATAGEALDFYVGHRTQVSLQTSFRSRKIASRVSGNEIQKNASMTAP